MRKSNDMGRYHIFYHYSGRAHMDGAGDGVAFFWGVLRKIPGKGLIDLCCSAPLPEGFLSRQLYMFDLVMVCVLRQLGIRRSACESSIARGVCV